MASLNRVYDDFEPTTEWVYEDGFDTLLVFLPGFKREEIKVQTTSAQNLRIMGERQVGENQWSRFRKEIPISSNHESHRISARFSNGILYIKHPKMIVPAEPKAVEEGEAKPKPKPTTETQKPSEPKAGEKKDAKESHKPLDPKSKSKPELQQVEKTDQKKETREPPKTVERKSEQKVDNKKEADHIRKETAAEKQPVERKKKTEEEKIKDSSEKNKKPSESVHKGDRKTRKEMAGSSGGSKGRKVESYQKNMGQFLVKLKKPGNLVGLVVMSLLVLVLALYMKKIIIPRGAIQTGIIEGQED